MDKCSFSLAIESELLVGVIIKTIKLMTMHWKKHSDSFYDSVTNVPHIL